MLKGANKTIRGTLAGRDVFTAFASETLKVVLVGLTLSLVVPIVTAQQEILWRGVVRLNAINVYQGASTNERVTATLRQGDSVNVVLEIALMGDRWCRVALPSHLEPLGYVLCFNLEQNQVAPRQIAQSEPVSTQSHVQVPAKFDPHTLTEVTVANRPALSNTDILNMYKIGLKPEILVAKIKSSQCNFDTSPASLQVMKNAGVNDNVILAMVQAPTGQTLPVAEREMAGSTASTPSPIVTPNPNMLSDDEVKLAMAGNGRNHSVLIYDMGLMAAQGNQVPSITLYLPEAVLAIQSESAKKQFTQYEPSEEEKRRSLMVVAEGYAGKTITEGCTSITRIVLLSSPAGGIVQEAYMAEPLNETWRNNFGATNNCQALRAKFLLADVQKVKAAALHGEFFVAVFSGTTNTKMYKVKRKHQSKLGLD